MPHFGETWKEDLYSAAKDAVDNQAGWRCDRREAYLRVIAALGEVTATMVEDMRYYLEEARCESSGE